MSAVHPMTEFTQSALVVWGIIVAITLILAFGLWLMIIMDAQRQAKEYVKRHGEH